MNKTYHDDPNGGGVTIGWGDTPCDAAFPPIVRHNYIANRSTELGLNCRNVTPSANVQNNVFLNLVLGFDETTHPHNIYFHGGYKYDTNYVFISPNAYEQGRANITIYNWLQLDEVEVNLKFTKLVNGDLFEIIDAQNPSGAPILIGVYDNTLVNIPMTNMAVAPIYGAVPEQPHHTSKKFGVFIVKRLNPNSRVQK